MKGIIIYSSQYGSTKQYAQWLGEDLKLETISYKDIKVKELEKYDFLILGSSIAAYKLTLSAWIIKNWEKLSTKKLFLFTVSGANPNDKKIEGFLDNSFSKDIQNKMEIFSLHGRMIFKKLPFMIQIVMKMVKNAQKDPETKRRFTEDYDFVKRENIAPMKDRISLALEKIPEASKPL